jgi:hypothetical protein
MKMSVSLHPKIVLDIVHRETPILRNRRVINIIGMG